ncbi:MAG: DNA-3-methyladenine glycosylase [Huintestinicola sp.]
MDIKILDRDFFHRDCLEVAPDLVGKLIIRTLDSGEKITLRITETEAYRGEEDTACHASKGRTPRTEILYGESGIIYVYLCYGIHWLMNVITGEKEQPQGVLIRACRDYSGPARLTKQLRIDRSFNGQSIADNDVICIADDGYRTDIIRKKRVGIDYADEYYRDILWRFCDSDEERKGKKA